MRVASRGVDSAVLGACRGPNGPVAGAYGALRRRGSAAARRGQDGSGQGFGAARGDGPRWASADAHGRNRPV